MNKLLKISLKLLVTPLFLTSLTVFAQTQTHPWHGLWKGEGTLTHSTGQIEKCQMLINIEQTATTFLVKQSLFDCETMKIKNNNQNVLTIANSQLWWDQTLLGSITNQEIHTQMTTAQDLHYQYDMVLPLPQFMNYHDKIEWVKNYTTEVSGTLTLQENLY